MCNKIPIVHVTKNNYVINDNKNKMAQGSGQRLKVEAEAEKPHVTVALFFLCMQVKKIKINICNMNTL